MIEAKEEIKASTFLSAVWDSSVSFEPKLNPPFPTEQVPGECFAARYRVCLVSAGRVIDQKEELKIGKVL